MSSSDSPHNLKITDDSFPCENLKTNGIVQGPWTSRRFSQTLVINFFGNLSKISKICSFNCRYCDLGATTIRLNKVKKEVSLPELAEIDSAIKSAFLQIHSAGPSVDTILISGHGEPTLHPNFEEAIQGIIAARNLFLPGRPIAVISNGSMLDSRKVLTSLNQIDQRIIKVDAGNERIFKELNSPLSRTTLAKVLDNIRQLKDVIIQSYFVRGAVDNTTPAELEEWYEVVAMIKPKLVYLQTVAPHMRQEDLSSCDDETLYFISAQLNRKYGIKSQVLISPESETSLSQKKS